MNNVIHWINHYPLDNAIGHGFPKTRIMLSNLDQGSQTANLKTVTHQTQNDYLPWNKHKNAIGSETKN